MKDIQPTFFGDHYQPVLRIFSQPESHDKRTALVFPSSNYIPLTKRSLNEISLYMTNENLQEPPVSSNSLTSALLHFRPCKQNFCMRKFNCFENRTCTLEPKSHMESTFESSAVVKKKQKTTSKKKSKSQGPKKLKRVKVGLKKLSSKSKKTKKTKKGKTKNGH